MKVLIVYAHPEPKSFNGALFCHAIRALEQAGHTVMTSDLYAMGFDPVSDRRNFTAASDPDFLKLQLEELAATEQDSLCSCARLAPPMAIQFSGASSRKSMPGRTGPEQSASRCS